MKLFFMIVSLLLVFSFGNNILAQELKKENLEELKVKSEENLQQKKAFVLDAEPKTNQLIGKKVNTVDYLKVEPTSSTSQLRTSQKSSVSENTVSESDLTLLGLYISKMEDMMNLVQSEIVYYLELIERRENAIKPKNGEILTPSELKTRKPSNMQSR